MITDQAAHRIAASWHGGGGSPLYQFASTGAIVPEVVPEVDDCLQDCQDGHDAKRLAMLRHYLTAKGPRGPVRGWAGTVAITEDD